MIFVIKISGEGLSEDDKKYTESVLESISGQIKSLLDNGHKISIVIGGGNLFRGKDLSGSLGIDRATADYIGMLATVQNALVLRDYFESKSISARVSSAIAMSQVCEEYIPKRAVRHMAKGRVVIFAAGLGVPYFSTDSCAVQRALEVGADMLIMAKNGVEGIYSADPKKDPSAELIKEITASSVVERGLKVADATAFSLCMDNGMPIMVFNLLTDGNIARAVAGEKIGTLVTTS